MVKAKLVMNFLATSAVSIGWFPGDTELIRNCRALKCRGAGHIARVEAEVFPFSLKSWVGEEGVGLIVVLSSISWQENQL